MLTPLGDAAILVRFDTQLSDAANRAALDMVRRLSNLHIAGIEEIVPNLVSVLVRYDPVAISFMTLAGELRLLLNSPDTESISKPSSHQIEVRFGGDEGADLNEVADLLQLSSADFIKAHNQADLRVLAIGFAPGFAYCGFHAAALHLPRRDVVRPLVPAGSILFAAGQTAIAATAIPTGWHVIGRTNFRNFDAQAKCPVTLKPGDLISFVEIGA